MRPVVFLRGNDMQEEYLGNGVDHGVHMPTPPIQKQNVPVDYSHIVSIIATWKDILNARLLALLALTGALFGFGFCMYDATPLRLTGLAIYAILCLWPTMALFLRKG